MEDLEKLRVRMVEAEAAYAGARDAYHAALCAAYPFRVGDIIQSADGKLAKVTKVYGRYSGVQMNAVAQNKNGVFGMRVANLWSAEWKYPQLHSRPDPAA